MNDADEGPHVVVVGGGFGGLWATRNLAGVAVRVTLIDRVNHHLFQPLLYQVAAASLSATDIAAPLRYIVRQQSNVQVWLAEVDHIDLAARRVRAGGRHLPYDYLVLATGSTHTYFGHPEWANDAPGLKTLDDAFLIRRRILTAFERAESEPDAERRRVWLTFAIVGAGPTGVELAGTLAEMARHVLPREFRTAQPQNAEIHLIEAGPRILPGMPPELSAAAQRRLEQLGVAVHVDAAVTAVDGAGVDTARWRIAARTVVWAAGVAASPLGRQLGVDCDRAGRVRVAPDLSLPGHPEVFVVGDLACVEREGRRVPGVAPAAKQMGAYAARMVQARLSGYTNRPFRYWDYGNLASISRRSAVVDLHGMHLTSVAGWWFWLVAHIFFLIGFRSRVAVMWNWAWSYMTRQRHARIIVGARPEER
ncbi:MAG TPA: NAD(P)/FAD-dependent oxidoreductase [Rhodanobacteraceae bacterium]|nr:NAD(P)/FAD-dependent oxidoreductase [Rhodanobacteraceae bacterium]